MTPEDIKIDMMMEEAIASSELAEEDLKLCHACNTTKHIRNGTICQECVVEMSDTGTIKLYTDEGAIRLGIEKIKNTKFPVGERKWCSKCEENIINVIKSK
jgi:hypothetical protein